MIAVGSFLRWVLAPGNGKTRIGRIWIYLVDERPWQGSQAPAAYYRYSPDRKGERPRDHLTSFHGVIQADAFSGYEALTRQVGPPGVNAPRIMHAACWAHYLDLHIRRTHAGNCSMNSSAPNRQSPRRHFGGSNSFMQSKPRSQARPRASGKRFGVTRRRPSSPILNPG